MEKKTSFLSLRNNFDSLLVGIAGWYIIFLFTKHAGIGLSPDSIVYTISAKNLAAHGALIAGNKPLTDFPVFYPFFLSSIIFITKQSPVIFGPLLNGFLFAAIIFLSGCIVQRFVIVSRLYKNIILLCILFSPALIEVYYMLWSETLFIFLLLLFFIAIKYYLRSHNLFQLIVAAFIVSLACITRYAGISIIGTGCAILLFDKELVWKKKLVHIPVFFVIGISLLSINLIHNYLHSGLLTGPREKGITPLIENIKYCGYVFCDWLPFFNGNYLLAAIVAILVFALACIFFVRHIFNNKNYSSYENIGLCFMIVYTVFIIASATLTHYETLNSRLLSPIFIPFLWNVSYPFLLLANKSRKLLKWFVVAASLSLAFFFMQNELWQTSDLYDDANTNGIPGYSEDVWQHSQLVAYLQQHKNIFDSANVLYSNDMEAFCFFTGNNCERLPNYVFKKEIEDYKSERPHYLIWFNNSENKSLFHLSDISKCKKITLLKSFPDGNIYWCD